MVTEIATRDRLQPSLLDRLTDDDPTNPKESADKRVLSLTQLKASVLRDLAWLLNTTSLLDADATLHTPAGTSVVNFGLPALAGNSASNVDLSALEALIQQAIATFEPRILRHTLRVRARSTAEMNHNALSFEIEGDLWAQPVPLRLMLQTDLDLETGHVRVVNADQRRRS
ncbi:type VI secretion system baseplate subunit TssE [Pseudomonas mediterranea]|uniref:Type VI secretion system protein ImpF n=1 Tax=Pseudomonas mediterranea TaxID=183795 RepID=A0AAX2D6M0_9PSED|nr:type VI secretion system baseplate subunit TssE [Pseudomonas mediterranea]KGU87360.1 type VI secretion system lysozyme [Pseudomonas mediterranea CFBP 5447]MBL0845577.1 type VI secretion system baseplate subunit TssE [Pseudomonas mediterranea]MDU9028133.1 type VI secretion system baseplate subunit TssE [Pseudomonas mediterranea]QHA85193.1 type VI secretion system baseplate subunit TssE [Pseudomonas mediterranea]UZE00930.1 type VI secretion system baseplate subunit TssE [Pseudomonas mediterra